MRHTMLFAATVLAWVAWSALPARAQLDFFEVNTDGTTLGDLPGHVLVGRKTTAPITVYTDSGTNVGGTLEAHNNARLQVNDGFVEFALLARDDSHITTHNIFAKDGLTAYERGRADIYGGIFGDGDFGNGLSAFDASTINMHGGIVLGDVQAFDTSTINISGGGILTDVLVRQNAVINLSGGIIGGQFAAFEGGTINVTGTDLTLNFQEETPWGNYFLLAGNLLDGTPLNHTAFLFPGGRVNLNVVPEPGIGALCAGAIVSGSLLVCRRKGGKK